jgi:hypothetical protein
MTSSSISVSSKVQALVPPSPERLSSSSATRTKVRGA